MSAELEYRNGKANMFYNLAGGTPWHQEGFKLTPDQMYDFDGLMEKHFNYPLQKVPYAQPVNPNIPFNEQKFFPSDDSFYIWRPDTQKKLGKVGSDYEIVPNKDVFSVLKPLLDTRVATIETGGTLRDGADAWLLVKWDLTKFGPNVQEVFGKDGGILPYGNAMANHSGRRGIMLGNSAIRVVCANTLGAAERESEEYGSKRWISVRHSGEAQTRLVEAANELFHNVIHRFEAIARAYKLLMDTHLEREKFKELVLDIVAPDPRKLPNWNPEASRAESVMARATAKRLEVIRLWMEGKGHTGEENAWYAYNAACEAIDHNKSLWPTRAGCYRTASLLDGGMSRMKNSVLDNLIDFACAV